MMRRATRFTALVIALLAVRAARHEAIAGPRFVVSIDRGKWQQFGFQYPATYVFRFSGNPQGAMRRCGPSGPWARLAEKTSAEFFNGIECVRFDRSAKRAYVSVGFQGANTIELELPGADSAQFEGIARFYDGRKAAYTLSNDNWGCNPWAHPGAPWRGTADDASDNYQASLHVCRQFHLPVSMAINSRMAGGDAWWGTMQEELDRRDNSWEPAVHGRTHPKGPPEYAILGYQAEILGCREDILTHLRNIPYGQYIFEHILTYGLEDEMIYRTDAGRFLLLRGFNWFDNPRSTDFVPWNKKYRYYGVGGLNTKGYDSVFERREPKGRYYAEDVAELNDAFDKVYRAGGLFYALWHPDRFRNSVLYDPSPGIDGVRGSTLMQHLAHVAGHKDIWYVANGWLYSYRYVAENASVAAHAGTQ